MNPQSLAELQALRIRAYGPAPDIHTDDEALRRLDELESLARAVTTAAAPSAGGNAAEPMRAAASDDAQEPPDIDGGTPVGDSALPDGSSAPSRTSVASAASAGSAGSGESGESGESADAAKGIRRKARRRTALWIVALVATAGLAAVIAHELSTVPVVTRDHDAVQVATLRVDPSFEWPEFFPPESSTGYEDYLGLTTVVTTSVYWVRGNGPCLAVMHTSDVDPGSDSIDGYVFNGCEAGDFPATVQFVVDDESPEALRERFPLGSALQFVMIDGRVAVFSDAE